MDKKTPALAATASPPAMDSGALPRGLALLRILIDAARPMMLSEIAAQSGLPASTVHRLLQVLEHAGWVYRDAAGRHCAGLEAVFPLPLDHPVNMLRRDATDILRTLHRQFSATALLTLFMGEQRVVVDAATGSADIATYIATRVISPWHCSVSGKFLLSELADADRDRLLGSAPYPRSTPATKTSRQQLFEELALIREEGVATVIDEHTVGISACGVKLRSASASSGCLGAISLTGASKYFTSDALARMRKEMQLAASLLGDSLSARAVARFLNI